jgi:hypothetical protein
MSADHAIEGLVELTFRSAFSLLLNDSCGLQPAEDGVLRCSATWVVLALGDAGLSQLWDLRNGYEAAPEGAVYQTGNLNAGGCEKRL